jgi:hypothetical protein
MDMLEELLASRVRAGIFRQLSGGEDAEIHLREMAVPKNGCTST